MENVVVVKHRMIEIQISLGTYLGYLGGAKHEANWRLADADSPNRIGNSVTNVLSHLYHYQVGA